MKPQRHRLNSPSVIMWTTFGSFLVRKALHRLNSPSVIRWTTFGSSRVRRAPHRLRLPTIIPAEPISHIITALFTSMPSSKKVFIGPQIKFHASLDDLCPSICRWFFTHFHFSIQPRNLFGKAAVGEHTHLNDCSESTSSFYCLRERQWSAKIIVALVMNTCHKMQRWSNRLRELERRLKSEREARPPDRVGAKERIAQLKEKNDSWRARH